MTTPRRPDLMAPSLGRSTRVVAEPGQEPWRLQSMFYVAFFGGTAALAWIAYQNAIRLQADEAVRKRIAIAGIVVSLITCVWIGMLNTNDAMAAALGNLLPGMRPGRVARLVMRIVAVVLYLLFLTWLKAADRRYIAFGDGERASLWRPGLTAVVAGDIVMLIVGAAFAILLGGSLTADFFRWR